MNKFSTWIVVLMIIYCYFLFCIWLNRYIFWALAVALISILTAIRVYLFSKKDEVKK